MLILVDLLNAMRKSALLRRSSSCTVIQIVRQAAENLIFFQAIGHAHLHRAIERQFALVNAVENSHRVLNDKIAFQQLAAELRARDFDSLRQAQFPDAA